MHVTKDMIQHKAYELWQARGCPNNSELEDWLTAEALLTRFVKTQDPVQEYPGKKKARYGLREFK